MAKQTKSRIVSATGVAAAQGGVKTDLSARVEKAMSEAILKAAENGVTDDNEIRKRMLAARDGVLKG